MIFIRGPLTIARNPPGGTTWPPFPVDQASEKLYRQSVQYTLLQMPRSMQLYSAALILDKYLLSALQGEYVLL